MVSERISMGAKVAMFIVGCVDELERRGYIEGGGFEMTEEGRTAYQELKHQGFGHEITRQDIVDFVVHSGKFDPAESDGFVTLVEHLINGKIDRFEKENPAHGGDR